MSAISFSAAGRSLFLRAVSREAPDMVIIGGGITGAGIALDAASRGMRVLLVEKDDFASGTSSRSTKLIHGGLRYLKQLEFGLVREVGKERAIVLRNAPHLVIPEPMLLPVIKGGSLGKTSTALGIWLYETLAGVSREQRGRMLHREATLQQEPLLDPGAVLGGALYTEYRTDDARLTIEVIKTAVAKGAYAVNYACVTGLIKEAGRLKGVRVKDILSGEEYAIEAKIVVNAAGPWVDQLRETDGSKTGKTLRLTKGVHIVVPHVRLPVSQPVYFDTPDGRMIFAIPRDSITYIGTTDTEYTGSPDRPAVTGEDARYLLDAVNALFPRAKLAMNDIESTWGGLRPLIHAEGKSPSELSRKDELFASPSGMLSIAGGKLTGYRKMAERVVNRVASILRESEGRTFPACHTDRLVLSGGGFPGRGALPAYIETQTSHAREIGGTVRQIAQLVARYGSNTEIIIERAFSLRTSTADKTDILTRAEIVYTIEQEMAVLPEDFWIRRTGALYFNRPGLLEHFERYYPVFAQFAGYNTDEAAAHKSRFMKLLAMPVVSS